jgi:hypothetical protein
MATITNWFVTATILFSLFTFSGYASLQDSSANPARIELIASLKKRGKRVTSFKLFKSKRIASCLSSLCVRIQASLFLFARQIKTQFSSNFKVLISFEDPEKVLILNYTPRNTEEFILYSFKG